MTTTTTCEGCALRAAEDRPMVCDGSGVIAVSDWPPEKSYALTCPEWACDADDPATLIDAQQWADPAPDPDPELLTAVMDAVRETRQIPAEDDYTNRWRNVGPALMIGAIALGFLGLAGLGVWLLLTGSGVL